MGVASFLFLFAVFQGIFSWEYPESGDWGGFCNGDRQSPININTNIRPTSQSPIKFINYDQNFDGRNIEIVNNKGHSVYVRLSKIKEDIRPKITGGILGSETYILEDFHFHWGSNFTRGSEHLFNGKAFSMEGHLVHRNAKYPNTATALNYTDGITVLGLMFREVPNFPTLFPLTFHFSKIRSCDQRSTLSGGTLNLRSLFPGLAGRTYYNYPGSLTTPTCNEVVNWIVFDNPRSVSYLDVSIS